MERKKTNFKSKLIFAHALDNIDWWSNSKTWNLFNAINFFVEFDQIMSSYCGIVREFSIDEANSFTPAC